MERDRAPQQAFEYLTRFVYMLARNVRQISDQGRELVLEVRQQRRDVVGLARLRLRPLLLKVFNAFVNSKRRD